MGMPQQQMMPQYGYGYGQNPQMGMQQPYGGMGAGGYQAYGAAAGVAGQAQGGMYPGGMQGYGAQGGAMGGMGAGMGAGGMQAKPAAAASQWSEHKTDEGVTYWYNSSTGVSQVHISCFVCSSYSPAIL
jgi:far upstream element-binding protein